jgi:hypothetical protein
VVSIREKKVMVAGHPDEGRLTRQLMLILSTALTWPGAQGICKVGMTGKILVNMNERSLADENIGNSFSDQRHGTLNISLVDSRDLRLKRPKGARIAALDLALCPAWLQSPFSLDSSIAASFGLW